MFGEFKWSLKILASLIAVAFVFTNYCFNLSENPAPNQTVIMPGVEFMMIGVFMIVIATFIGKIRNGLFFSFNSSFQPNFFEAYLALTGVAIFLSPLLAVLFKFLRLVSNANT